MIPNHKGLDLLERVQEPSLEMPRPPGRLRSLAGFLGDLWPTLLMLTVAGGVGWWGHHTGWKMPKWSELLGSTSSKPDWCSNHTVPESACVECNPELMPRPTPRGWCPEHGVHECPLCYPDLAQTQKLPAVTSADRERAERSLHFTERPGNNPTCKLHQRRIQFASEEAVDRAGVFVEPVWTGPVREFVASPGEITYDQTRVAHLGSRASGTVWRVYKHLGDPVEAGEILTLIEATEVGKAKSDLLQAVAQAQLRAQTLATARGGSTVLPPARLREAEAGYREAQIHVAAARQMLVNLGLTLDPIELETIPTDELEKRLRFAGLPAPITRTLDPQKTTSALLPVVAPMAGVVVSREVVAGEVVDPSRVLFEVVDTSRLWLTFHVAVEDARRLRIDQPVDYTPDGSKEFLTARITWISTRADPKTRTVEVRANLPDPEGRQRANTFGTGKIILRDEPEVVVVPSEAVHWEGCCHVVFVRDRNYLKPDAPKVFHTRTVRIGAVDTKQTEIIAGVLPGELVAVKNSGVLRAELLRGNLGEG